MAVRRSVLRVLTVVCQLAVGVVFVFSGLVKCIDPVGTSIKLDDYLHALGWTALTDWSLGLAWALSLAEFVVGMNVLFGRNRRVFPWAAAAFMLAFTPLTLWLALTDAVTDCGCFGDAVVLTGWQTFWKNIALSVAVAVVCWRRSELVHTVRHTPYTLHFYWSLLVAVALCAVGTWREPFIDFRPFRHGVHIPTAMGMTGNDEWTETYGILYERDGVRREFPLDSLPDDDEGWEFVDQVVHRVAGSDNGPSQPPAIKDFFVRNGDGEDITELLLSDTSYVFLLLSPSLDAASEHDVDRIERVYEYASQWDYGFTCLTARDAGQVSRWRDRTGAEYPMIYTDASVVATITRSNPAMLLLHRGTILWKKALPQVDVGELSGKLSEQRLGQPQPIDRKLRVFYLLALMFGPIVLYLLFELPFTITKKT